MYLIGDALVNEDDRLQVRINQVHDRIELTLKQCLKITVAQGGKKIFPEIQSNLMMCYVVGRWHQFVKSGFKRKPTELVQQQLNQFTY